LRGLIQRISPSTEAGTLIKAMVDTEIWNAAKKRPSREKFSSEKGFRKALAMHERARAFFEEEFPRLKVYN